MKKTATILFSLGIVLVAAGYVLAPRPSISEDGIRALYECDRGTDDYRRTDKYCVDPYSAPVAKERSLDNYLVYTGFTLVVIGGIVAIRINSRPRAGA